MSKLKEAVYIVSVEKSEGGGTVTHHRWIGDKEAIRQGKRIIADDVIMKIRNINF